MQDISEFPLNYQAKTQKEIMGSFDFSMSFDFRSVFSQRSCIMNCS